MGGAWSGRECCVAAGSVYNAGRRLGDTGELAGAAGDKKVTADDGLAGTSRGDD